MAARLLARGHGTMSVARRLGINHHTIAVWKHDAHFAAELDQLHAKLAAAALKLPRSPRILDWLQRCARGAS
jgi:transposase-like protein